MGRWVWGGGAGGGGAAVGTALDTSLSAGSLAGAFAPLSGSVRAFRARVMQLLAEDVFRPAYGEDLAAERARCWARIMRLAEAGVFKGTITAMGDARRDAAERYDTVLACVALVDHSLEVKIGVSLGLFGTTVRRLGSPDQLRYWLPKIESFREFGCYALTELGHGSNVRGIETTATYDKAADAFILRTPTESAQKYWIGGAAYSSTVSVVFAQLHIGGRNEGIHAFIVRLRDKSGAPPRPGIHIEDCGVKAGLNGVDNGRIWFDSLRVPRSDMLCGISSVSPDGIYSSQISSPDARFGAALAALTGGRVSIAVNAVNIAKIGLTIAVRYTRARRAFAPAPGAPEAPLLSYASIQRRLMLPLATAYVYGFCCEDLRAMWFDCVVAGEVSKEVHVLSAGFKAQCTWFMSEALQHARECCGGQGYKSENRICVMRADRDVMLTFEGANDVMMQQVGKALLSEFSGSGRLPSDDGGESASIALDASDPSTSGRSVVTTAKFVRRALHARELHLVRAVRAQIAQLSKGQKKGFAAAWNASLNLASEAATAHMHRLIWDMHVGHIARVRKLADKASSDALRLCGELWALNVLDSDPGFLRFGCIDARQAGEIHSSVDILCGRLASIADTLVDGFDFPPHVLAPIAFDYVAHNSRARL